jgi:hypothetical protein
MGKHSPTEAAGKRARACAWLVFISMAGTTMSFQVYHSIRHGNMPWPLAVLYGVVPLFISMLVIEVVSGWEDAPKWVRWAAYLIIGGAMYLSAAATGAVVLRAAPPHSSLLFGLLLDGAAILAARFLMTATRKAAIAELASALAALAAEREARAEAGAFADGLRDECDQARQREADATAEVDALRRELAAERAGNATGNGDRKRKPATGSRTVRATGSRSGQGAGPDDIEDAPEDLDAEAKVLWYLDRGVKASPAGVRAGLTDSRGRQIARLRRPAPKGLDEGGSP